VATLADYRLDQGCDVTRAAGQIQHAVAAANAADGHEMALPQEMDAERHQIVHQVVVAGDRGENLADQLLLLRDRNVTKAEVGSGLLAHARMVQDAWCGRDRVCTVSPCRVPAARARARDARRPRGVHAALRWCSWARTIP